MFFKKSAGLSSLLVQRALMVSFLSLVSSGVLAEAPSHVKSSPSVSASAEDPIETLPDPKGVNTPPVQVKKSLPSIQSNEPMVEIKELHS